MGEEEPYNSEPPEQSCLLRWTEQIASFCFWPEWGLNPIPSDPQSEIQDHKTARAVLFFFPRYRAGPLVGVVGLPWRIINFILFIYIIGHLLMKLRLCCISAVELPTVNIRNERSKTYASVFALNKKRLSKHIYIPLRRLSQTQHTI
jgi:hypothetical protein